MEKEPSIQVLWIRGILGKLEADGYDPSIVVERLKLDGSVLDDPDGRIPLQIFMQAFDLAAELTGDDHFGLHFGAAMSLKSFGLLGYVMMHSRDIRTAFENLGRFMRLDLDRGEVAIEEDGDNDLARLTYRITAPEIANVRHDAENAAMFAVNMIREMLATEWVPEEVHFAHAETDDLLELKRLLRAPLYFNQDATGALIVRKSVLDEPVRGADPALLQILEHFAQETLENLPAVDDFVADVRKHIAHALRDGHPSVDSIAARVGMSARTLQRRLGEYGVLYNELVDEIRHNMSQRYLREPKLALTEIAFLLGYSEVGTFTRACRRWTGLTPREYRRQIQATA